jgi:hypothetical protein
VIDTYLASCAPAATRSAFGLAQDSQPATPGVARGIPVRLVFGFEKGESARARRATEYDTPGRVAEFPLLTWGWDRERCVRFIERVTGVRDWPKSACVYCPFSLTSAAGRERSLLRYDGRPRAALEALLLERRALCLNPRGGLIAGDRLIDLIETYRPAIARQFQRQLDVTRHAVYEVRRLWRPKTTDPLSVANANRDLSVLDESDRRTCEARVRELGDVDRHDSIERVYRLRRGDQLPAREQFIVAGPAGAVERAMPSFETWWAQAACAQLELLSATGR